MVASPEFRPLKIWLCRVKSRDQHLSASGRVDASSRTCLPLQLLQLLRLLLLPLPLLLVVVTAAAAAAAAAEVARLGVRVGPSFDTQIALFIRSLPPRMW